ncbi:MAG: acyl-CoA dehydrogenase [Deltaproteobacteria bacterium]|nr:MAG: acyl-CoA dehydrogenase [Deltaproteobacteria bacterium]
MRSLCLGVIDEDMLLPFPRIGGETAETLRAVIDSIDDLLGPRAEDFRAWDAAGELPREFVDELRAFGLFGLVVPEEHGGLGFGSLAYSRTLQQIARHDASVAVTVGAHNSIGMRGLLLFGTEEQRRRYYPKLASGEMIAAFCLTEPEAGSDAASVKTTAVDEGDHFRLNGSKLWITNVEIADFFTVFAKTGPKDSRGKLSAFIVTRDMPGVSVAPHEDKMGLRASYTNAVFFDDVKVPKENLLGPLHGGFKVAMKILNSGRSGLGGGAVGAMKRLIELASHQARERRQFGRPIGEFGLVKQKIGQMVVDCYAAEAVVTLVAGWVDAGSEDYAVEAAIGKVFASEALWRTADEALQVAGGNGYMRDYPYERFLRDSRINRIFEGTNEILRLFIALNAMNDVGAQLQELAASLQDVFVHPIKGFGVLSEYARKHVSLATGAGRSRFTQLHPRLDRAASQFEGHVRVLAQVVDRLLRKHGRNIVEKQLATRRLADIMIDLFVLAAVLARVDAQIRSRGEAASHRDLQILDVFAGGARRRIAQNLADVDDNEDEPLKDLADYAMDRGGYGWDVFG